MEYRCELVEREARPALVVRTRAPVERLPEVIGQAYGAVMAYAAELGAEPSGAPFVAYHNMDMADLDMEIGFPFGQALPGKSSVLASEIPGKGATCLHIGPYEQLGQAYESLGQWVQENGYEPTGVAYEFYLNNAQDTPPNELQTQLLFPIK